MRGANIVTEWGREKGQDGSGDAGEYATKMLTRGGDGDVRTKHTSGSANSADGADRQSLATAVVTWAPLRIDLG